MTTKDDDILDCMDWSEDNLTEEQKAKVDKAEKEAQDTINKLNKAGKPYFCSNANLILQMFGMKLKDGEAFNTREGLMVVCNNNVKDLAFFTSLDIKQEELDELRSN